MSPTIGRNEPCPCGSGKKFKKCCLQKEREIPDFKEKKENLFLFSNYQKTQKEKGEYLEEFTYYPSHAHPYTIARISERPSKEFLKKLFNEEPTKLSKRWTISRVDSLTSEEICDRLLEQGAICLRSSWWTVSHIISVVILAEELSEGRSGFQGFFVNPFDLVYHDG